MNFGKRLKTLRAARELTQKELAKLTRIRNTDISSMETGKILPGPEWERRLREALGWDENAEGALAILEGQVEQEPA